MSSTPTSSKFLGLLRRSPRSSSATPSPANTAPGPDDGRIVVLAPGDVGLPPIRPEANMGAFEISVSVLREAASLASTVPYVGAIAGIFLQIIRIKSEVDLYREEWEEVMYNVVKVVDLVKHFSESCKRHGLCDERTFPQNFISIINELESEFRRVAAALSQCRGKSRFEQFKRGLARNDMVREIQRCDRQMNRIFERFMAAMVVDIRFQQLFAERAQSTPVPMPVPITAPVPTPMPTPIFMSMPIPTISTPVPTPISIQIPLPSPVSVPMPMPMPNPAPPATMEESQLIVPYSLPFPRLQIVTEPSTPPSSHVRQPSAGSSTILPFPRPIRPQVFFGRDAELKTIVDLIFSSASSARVAILGPGGVGKSALAHAVLTHDKVAARFGDSRYLIPCDSLKSRDALLVALADRFSLLQPGTASESYSVGLESRVLSALALEECLLCLDDFESPWDQPGASRKAVELLLADITAITSVTVLITMRGGERPKETKWSSPMLTPLTNFRRDAAKRTWECLAGTCDEWAEKLIDVVDCQPLAVTLLGSLAEVATAETLWERWQKENIAVVEKEKGNKQASLDFSIALSLESGRMATDPASRRLLGILSLLPDGMPASPSPEFRRFFPDIPDISRSLDTLLGCSLAVRTAGKRVQVNSLVRLYCENHAVAAPEDRRALRDYYVTLASHGYDNLSDDLFKRMTTEMNNMESVLQRSLTWTPPSEITPVVEAMIAYTQFGSFIGNFSDAVITCAIQAQGLSDETLGDCLTSLGSICLSDDRVNAAEEHFLRALTLHQKAQDVVGQANDYCHLGDVSYRSDEMEEAKTNYRKAYDLYVQLDNTYGQANVLTHLGDTYRKLGNLEESCSSYKRSLEFHEGHGDPLGQANSLKGLGHVHLRMDDIKLARECFERALELHKAVNDLVGQANDTSSLADIYQRSDNLTKAEEAYKEALHLHNQAKDYLGRGNALSHLGDLYRKQGKLSEAEDHYSQALQSHEKAFDKLGQANDLKGLGGIYHRQGDNDKAISKYNAALDLYQATNNSLGRANCQRSIGYIYYFQNKLSDALPMFQDALEDYRRANDSIGQGNALNNLGDVERRRGRLPEAEQQYKQALQAHQKANDGVGQGNDYKGLGIVYQKLNRLKDAKEMFEKAIEMHRQCGSLKNEKQDEAYLKKVDKKLAQSSSLSFKK